MFPSRLSDDSVATVSIVVPCFNAESVLSDSIDSALRQQGVHIEVIVVDDYSNDGTLCVAERAADADRRVRVLRHDQFLGPAETANHGLAAATGEFFGQLKPGEILAPGSLARATALLRSFPTTNFAFGKVQARGASAVAGPNKSRGDYWTIWAGHDWLAQLLSSGNGIRALPGVVMRRSAIQEAGGYSKGLEWADCLNLLLRLAAIGSVGRVDGFVQGYYPIPDPAPGVESQIRSADLRVLAKAYDLFFDDQAGSLEDVQGMRTLARTSLARRVARVCEQSGSDAGELSDAADQLRSQRDRSFGRTHASVGVTGRLVVAVSDRLGRRNSRVESDFPGLFDQC